MMGLGCICCADCDLTIQKQEETARVNVGWSQGHEGCYLQRFNVEVSGRGECTVELGVGFSGVCGGIVGDHFAQPVCDLQGE